MANNTSTAAPVDTRLIDRLRKILALTQSPNENEAASAADMLQRFLVEYNLSVADLEQKGSKPAAPVTESGVDLGKAAFNWKLDLAEAIAEHYFCVGIINRIRKTVTFVGRPDNVESLKLLYAWVVDQIKRLAAEERKRHQAETGEHIDPLRWQVNFGEGAGGRLVDRLERVKGQHADASTTALVLHHQKEISDYTESKYNRRYDGQQTERQKKWTKENEQYWAECEAQEKRQLAEDEKLLATDPDAYYRQYPSRHPDIVLEQQRREARNAARRAAYVSRPRYSYGYDYDKEDQASTASSAGRKSADRINLEPFLTGKVGTPASLPKKGKGK